MNIQELETNEISRANHLIANFAKDVIAESKRAVDTEKYGWMRRCLDDVIFWVSIFVVLFLVASVIAIAFYTVT
jgi:type IV secretory pathway component VirB8